MRDGRATVALANVLSVAVLLQATLPLVPAHADEFGSTVERMKAEAQRRRELLSKTYVPELELCLSDTGLRVSNPSFQQ